MKIEGTPKEIADFVLEVQNRQQSIEIKSPILSTDEIMQLTNDLKTTKSGSDFKGIFLELGNPTAENPQRLEETKPMF